MNSPLIIAHRGDSRNAPENTLTAFRSAIEAGADGLEFDVRITRDGVPVVIHDATLDRTGLRPEKISEISSSQLDEIYVGSWFSTLNIDRSRPEFSMEKLPTLSEVLENFRNYKGLFYIELKSEVTDPDLAAAVCKIISDSHLLPQIIIKSFDLTLLRIVRTILPKVQTAALFEPTFKILTRSRDRLIKLAIEAGAQQLSIHYFLLSKKLMRAAEQASMPVTVWTVDDPSWAVRHRDFNIKALITNDPNRFLASRD